MTFSMEIEKALKMCASETGSKVGVWHVDHMHARLDFQDTACVK